MKTLLLSIFSITVLNMGYSQTFSATDSVVVTGTNSYAGEGRGFSFTPNVNIYVTAMGKYIPNADGNYTWVIWEVAGQITVYSQTSTFNVAAQYHYEPTDSVIMLSAGTQYILEMYCDNTGAPQYYFGVSSQINANLTYGQMHYCNTCTPTTYPNQTLTNYHYGIPDFHFSLCAPATMTLTETACDSYTSPSGNYTWTSSGVYNDTLTGSGCDTIVTVNLTINSNDTSITQTDVITLMSNDTTASYVWLDCNSNTPIGSEISQSYTATANGDYAVIVNNSGCIDTSACYNISGVGVFENTFPYEINAYPNPTFNGDFNITIEGQNSDETNIIITNAQGRKIKELSFTNTNNFNISLTDQAAGIYFINIQTEGHYANISILKK